MYRDVLTRGTYELTESPTSRLQIFEVKHDKEDGEATGDHPPLYQYVKLFIDSNHGHENYTCLYKFLVYAA